eukprot:Tamp_23081.p1 GENE.Tamp_23081~~Tamp_23081.p1  ORF type:complete len:181 (+),score=21.65 Tamp_23081:105-647(+)
MEGQKFRESKARIDGDPVSMSGAGPGALIRLRSEVVTAKDLLGVAAVLGVVRDVCGEQATLLAPERPSRPGRPHSSRKAPSARRVQGQDFLGGDLESFVPDDLRHLVPTAQASWRKTIKVHSSACANAGAAGLPNVGIQISMQWVLFTVAIVFARADVCARLRMHATASPLPVGRVLACV